MKADSRLESDTGHILLGIVYFLEGGQALADGGWRFATLEIDRYPPH